MTGSPDTITAIATARGIGSIAIVRLSGPDSLAIAKLMTCKNAFKPRYATLCEVYDPDEEMIDESLVIYFKAPKSFTTEDIIEFQCHGGEVAAQRILESVLFHGARLASPGEFSKRAFLGGRIDLSQAEAAARLIESKSLDAARVLAKQLKGHLHSYCESIREQLSMLLAQSEVNIDYAQEDLPADLQQQMIDSLDYLSGLLQQTLDSSIRRKGMLDGYKLAIIGKPNVGKSSLLNRLLDDDRAIVSDIAGTTRDTIEESFKIGSHLVKIADTAGIRQAKDHIELIGIERARKIMQESDVILALFDSSAPLDDEDRAIIESIKNPGSDKEIIAILTKTDLPPKADTSSLNGFETLFLHKDASLHPLLSKLETFLNANADYSETLLVSTRQNNAVRQALVSIQSAYIPLSSGELELFSFHINEAIEHVATITRPYEHTEMLDKMFGHFCLGK